MQQQAINNVSEKPKALTLSIALQITSAIAIGAAMLFVVGFAPMDAAHNAAHDTRHSFAFPCH